MTTKLLVKTLGGVLTKALLAGSQQGLCALLPSGDFLPSTDLKIGLPPGPERTAEEPRFMQARSRRIVDDKRTIPEDCPLRNAEMVVTLAAEN